MAGMRCSFWATPVTIEAAHTGVTEGNAATHAGTYVPRSISSARIGATPLATARSSIAGAIASITHRTSLGGWDTDYRPRIRSPAYFSPARRRLESTSHAQGSSVR